MYVPLSFRVIGLHATDNSPHEATLLEVRRALVSNQPSPQTVRPESPPQTFSVVVTPEQFSHLSVGMTFDLEPQMPPEKSIGIQGAVSYR